MQEKFKIFQLTPEEALRIEQGSNNPHFHSYEELIIGVRGKLTHFIDFQSIDLEAPFVSFISKGKLHKVQSKAIEGELLFWVIRFKSEFIPELIFHLYAFYHNSANIVLPKDFCFERMAKLCEIMDDEMKGPAPDESVLRYLLSGLFAMIEAERRKQEKDINPVLQTQNETFKQFLNLLEANYKRGTGVEFYAEKLFMSSKNLNLIARNVMQQSISEIIETRKLTEAKHLLVSTDKSISEIGFELGYKEKSYFTNVFKKKSGQTPTEFREEMKKLVS